MKVLEFHGEVKVANLDLSMKVCVKRESYLLYLDYVNIYISDLEIGCYFGLSRINIKSYADDLVLTAISSKKLQFFMITLIVFYN